MFSHNPTKLSDFIFLTFTNLCELPTFSFNYFSIEPLKPHSFSSSCTLAILSDHEVVAYSRKSTQKIYHFLKRYQTSLTFHQLVDRFYIYIAMIHTDLNIIGGKLSNPYVGYFNYKCDYMFLPFFHLHYY